jgi:hypothetical protein
MVLVTALVLRLLLGSKHDKKSNGAESLQLLFRNERRWLRVAISSAK